MSLWKWPKPTAAAVPVSFTLKHYDLSKTIGQRKRDNIVHSGAQVAAAGCPACMMQMMDMRFPTTTTTLL